MTMSTQPIEVGHPGSAHSAVRHFYRPELDVLRFMAFLLVFLHHTLPREGLIPGLSVQLSLVVTSVAKACGFGLSLFFALSAYLITELLVREKTAKGKLAIKAFYIRRILRIWPLYFLGLGIGVAIAVLKPTAGVPVSGILERYAAYAALVGNWYCAAHIASSGRSPMEILWSISVEEQFYLFWPWLAGAKAKRLLQIAAVSLIVISAVALLVLGSVGATTEQAWFNSFVEFGVFGAGAILSLQLRGTAPGWGFGLRAGIASIALALWFVACYWLHIKDNGPAISGSSLLAGYVAVEFGCVLLLLSVLGIAPTKSPKGLIYLGQISFGLYVFHELALNIATVCLRSLRISHQGLIQPFLGLTLAIAIASVSYRFYERPFLKLKKRIEIVKTRPV